MFQENMSDLKKLNDKVEAAIKKMNSCIDRPYLITKAELIASISKLLEVTLKEKEKVNLLTSILIIGIIGLMLMIFIIWTLFFTVPLA